MKRKIVVAMSGGVDSSVAAALLKRQGHEVIGISLQLWDYGAGDRFGTCCSLDDLADARRVADKLEMPFYILNMEKEFKEDVVDYFVSEYRQGRTPIPCTLCNQKVKFDRLMERAEILGCDFLATGHYASVVRDGSGRLTIRRGRDRHKDQSYFLFNLSQEQIRRLMFPLGDMEKQEVRGLARGLGLRVAEKSESQEICFVPDNDYAEFLAQQSDAEIFTEGPVVDAAGNALGTHKGFAAYTVGQRKGLNLGGLSEPYFVTGIDAKRNKITVGPKRETLRKEFFVDRVNWCLEPDTAPRAAVQIRSHHRAATAHLTPLAGGRAQVVFDEPQLAVAPGQAAVFYRNDCIVGGGWIE